MNKQALIAAVLCFIAAVIRTIDGESQVLLAATESVESQTLLGFIRLTWYLVTITFVISGVALARFSLKPGPPGASIASFLGVLFLSWCIAILAIGVSFVWHAGIVVPAIVTLAIGVLSLSAAKHKKGDAVPNS